MEKGNRPKVGIGIYIIRDGKVLMGLRQGSHGPDTWCPPGGHLEYGESWEACARREALEECGLEMGAPIFFAATNDVYESEGKHYVTIFLIAEYVGGEAKRLEPEKCKEWRWFSWNELPDNLFLPVTHIKEQGLDPTKPLKASGFDSTTI